jgi:cyclophilin family peptidyl-prolyl cis-trans isomerase
VSRIRPSWGCAAAVAVVCLSGLAHVRAQGRGADPPASIQALRQAIFEAEDRRAPTEADLETLLAGARHPDEAVQRMAVRALGRLERTALVGSIEPALSSRFASVRAVGADAIGQAVSAAGGEAAAAVQASLLKRLAVERDPAVVGAMCWTLGRLPYSAPQAMRTAEVTLLVAALPLDSDAGQPLPLRLGLARGFEALIRRNARAFTPSSETVRRMKQFALNRLTPRRGEDAEDLARVRRLALAALASAKQADEATLTAAAADPDPQARRLAIVALAGAPPALVPWPARVRLMEATLADPDPLVRYEALRVHARSLTVAGADSAPVFAAVDDASAHVALLAIDLLASGQLDRARAIGILQREAAALPAEAPAPVNWHRAAHALVSLARIAPAEASALLPRFEASAHWPVRMYAARAATWLRNVESVTRLARDERDNVREAAIEGLKTVAGHDADGLYIEALGRPDYQLVMTAVNALVDTPRRTEAVRALAAALARITVEGRDTSRDARLSLIGWIGKLGQAADALALIPYLTDFDPQIADSAAAAIGTLTGLPAPTPAPRPRPVAVPALADIERLRGARARLTITGRGVFEAVLLPDEAPATVARFVSLARAGYYNGLTFHRVVPAFIVQGGSPAANEYVGDGPFMRDEIGLEPHVRGAASISTRGRDTGDAQIWFNLVDNPRLDHDYTVFGRVTSGAGVLDGILECDVIERVEIIERPRR